ncbi:unnamed protein product [Callosobruchus maculatus]|uniref:Uncharacterized protein n=1 Tax=Callosobruchus maculatus TaxID=64391 RepID=A0A653BS42_CALMS|nr:unnamed protein product [Callosobruchus maculatus]
MATNFLRQHFCTEMYYSGLLFCLYPIENRIKKIILLNIYTAVMITVHSFVWYKFLSLKRFYLIDTFEFSAVTVLIATAFFMSTVSSWKSQFAIKQWKVLIQNLSVNPRNNPGRLIWYSIIIIFQIAANVHIHYGMTIHPNQFIYEELMSLMCIGVTVNSLFANRLLNSIELKVAEIKFKLQAEIVTYNSIALKADSNDYFSIYLSVSEMDKIVESFLGILKGIQSFNTIFGQTIIGLAIFATMSIANAMYIALIPHASMDTYFMRCVLTKKVIINIAYLVYCFLYIQPCVRTTSHLGEAVKITCRLSTKLPHNAANPNYILFQRKLDLLNKQLNTRKPYFSATDVFDVDYSIFLYIFAGVSSIVVVYVQLK